MPRKREKKNSTVSLNRTQTRRSTGECPLAFPGYSEYSFGILRVLGENTFRNIPRNIEGLGSTHSGIFTSCCMLAQLCLVCERVFLLLKLMFGEQQMEVLRYYIQAALMLRYNNRRVG